MTITEPLRSFIKIETVINMTMVQLDGKKMNSIEQAHKYISEKLQFPDYYGENLDALWDMLGEIFEPTVIELINAKDLKKNLGQDAESLIDVFLDAEEENENIEFEVM